MKLNRVKGKEVSSYFVCACVCVRVSVCLCDMMSLCARVGVCMHVHIHSHVHPWTLPVPYGWSPRVYTDTHQNNKRVKAKSLAIVRWSGIQWYMCFCEGFMLYHNNRILITGSFVLQLKSPTFCCSLLSSTLLMGTIIFICLHMIKSL